MINPVFAMVAPIFAGLILPYLYRYIQRYARLLLQLLFLSDIVILSMAASAAAKTPQIVYIGTLKHSITAGFLFSTSTIYILMVFNFTAILLTMFIKSEGGVIESLHEKIITLLPLFIGSVSMLICSADRVMMFAFYDIMLIILLSVYVSFSSQITLRRQYSIVAIFSMSAILMGMSAGTGVITNHSFVHAGSSGLSGIFLYLSTVLVIPALFSVTNLLASKKHNFILFTLMMLVVYILVYILYRYPLNSSLPGSILLAITGSAVAVTGALFSVFKHNTWERILYLSMIDAGSAIFLLSSQSAGLNQDVMNSFTFCILIDIIMVIVMGRLEINEKYSRIMFRSFPLATVVMIAAVLMRLFIPPFPGFTGTFTVIQKCFSSGLNSYAAFTIFVSSLQLTIFFRIMRDILKDMDEIYSYERKGESGGWGLLMILSVMIFISAAPFSIMKNPFGSDGNDTKKAYLRMYRADKAEDLADEQINKKLIIGD